MEVLEKIEAIISNTTVKTLQTTFETEHGKLYLQYTSDDCCCGDDCCEDDDQNCCEDDDLDPANFDDSEEETGPEVKAAEKHKK